MTTLTASTVDRSRLASVIVELLDEATRLDLPADSIRARLDEIAAEHSGARLHLISHQESYDGSVSYDVLIRGTGPAWSVGIAGSSTLPWPMRGVVRVTDQHVVRVNGRLLWLHEVIGLLDEVFEDVRLARQVVYLALLEAELADHPIELSDDEIQSAADAYRRAEGLHTAEQTKAWLARRHMSEDGFQELVERTARLDRLRRRIAMDGVDAAFASDPDRYRAVTVAWIDGGSPDPEVGADPLAAVLAAHACGRAGGITRWHAADLPAGATRLATIPPGQPIEVHLEHGPALAVVLSRTEPALDGPTRDRIERELFDTWLENRRRQADVQWFWGQTWQTDGLG